ncbi:hypothetical protein [Bacillus sp. FJAT-49736]|nr:hypothetical protein [Bacillus sp. FJAT-49736]MBS4172081.1 hypothetical protein [Bacillus sp. FJAT-49736]
MDFAEKALWAELKYKVYLAALMVNDGYTNEDVIDQLMEIVQILENSTP